MKKFPIGIQTFEKIIQQNYIYVDKTKYVYELTETGTFYFLSRPRRFGKSLLLSTFKSVFEGKKELFKDLYIYKKKEDWKKHPIIYIDYSHIAYREGGLVFRQSLLSYLKSIATSYQLTIEEISIPNYFSELVKNLYNNYGSVVILVDEYDKPLVDTLTNESFFNENRIVLNELYGIMKSLDAFLRFVFLTGVSRFAKVGVFSGMNNLNDLSINQQFNNIVGFSQEELEFYFSNYISDLAKTFDYPIPALKEQIKFWYNGFSWDGQHKLYNPFSVLNLFNEQRFNNFWFSTGTPTFLIDLIKKEKKLPQDLENTVVIDLVGNSMNTRQLSLLPLLFQTGYLTIDKIERDGVRERYYLNYPNEEVRHSFLTYILSAYLAKDEFSVQPETIQLREALINEQFDTFFKIIRSFFADIPSRLHLPREAYYHSLIYLLLRLVGVQLLLEKETNKGRIDGVFIHNDKVYIIEFKFAENKRIKHAKTLAKKAIQQILDRNYYEPYVGKYNRIILLGIGFLDKEIVGEVRIL